jgi:hypothetical protein
MERSSESICLSRAKTRIFILLPMIGMPRKCQLFHSWALSRTFLTMIVNKLSQPVQHFTSLRSCKVISSRERESSCFFSGGVSIQLLSESIAIQFFFFLTKDTNDWKSDHDQSWVGHLCDFILFNVILRLRIFDISTDVWYL